MRKRNTSRGGKVIQTGLRLPEDLYHRAKVAAAEMKISVSELTACALEAYLKGSTR